MEQSGLLFARLIGLGLSPQFLTLLLATYYDDTTMLEL